MIDLERIVGFDWDSGNSRKNVNHGVSQSEAEQVFFDPRLLMVPDLVHAAGETRFHALSQTIEGRYLHVTLTLRSSEALIRVISARDMHRKERVNYDRKD
ncbi:MAG: BrnT family toxin [Betaproteobacteria bacterium]